MFDSLKEIRAPVNNGAEDENERFCSEVEAALVNNIEEMVMGNLVKEGFDEIKLLLTEIYKEN